MVGGGGLPLLFQGCEVVQTGWWDNDGHHGLQWSLAEDDTGRAMIKAVADVNLVRCENAALRGGWYVGIRRALCTHASFPGLMCCMRTR